MKMLKKIGALVLAISMMAPIAGCGERKVSSDDKVTLKWVLAGPGNQRDSEEVWDLFNEKLAEVLPNTKVEFEVIATSDFAEKWQLMAASSEEVDIVWTGYVLNFVNEVENGSYIPLDELLNEYAPNLRASMDEWVWDKTRYDGKIYAIPNYQMMVSRPTAIRTPEALADKYLDKERIRTALENWSNNPEAVMMTDEVFDALEDYCAKLQAAGQLGKGISPNVFEWVNTVSGKNRTKFQNMSFAYVEKGDDGKLSVIDNRENERNFYKRIAQLYQKGYIRKDALTVSDLNADNGVEGGHIMWIHNYDDYTKQSEDVKYGMPIYYIPTTGSDEIVCQRSTSASATSTAISRTSKNPERAMQLLEIINSGEHKDLYNLLVYGIEGKHYEVTGENVIKTLEYDGNPTMESSYGIQKWIVGNTFNAYDTQTDVPGYNKYTEEVLHGQSADSIVLGFQFEEDAVKNELAQIKSIISEFSGLTTGAHDNWEEMFDRRNKKLSDVGFEKFIEEGQRQLDEQLNNK